jgi:hypothetical protein
MIVNVIMKPLFIIVILVFGIHCPIFAQSNVNEYKPFINSQTIIDRSGPGLTHPSGDILLELSGSQDDDYEGLVLLRSTNGKLVKIAENGGLLMKKEFLGAAGGNNPTLSVDELSVNYTMGSSSLQSEVTISFKKSSDGNYYFKEYQAKTSNYGVENLFARQVISSQQIGKINFSATTASQFFDKPQTSPKKTDVTNGVLQATDRYKEYIPQDWILAAFAEGDLNLDAYKKDVLLFLYNNDSCRIAILLQQKDNSYKLSTTNNTLVPMDEKFNANNTKAVIKNGYFTIERRVATQDDQFDHQYITFKYDEKLGNWWLYRYDVEHYSGFDLKPAANVTHLTKQDFGTVSFQEITHAPARTK